MKILIFAAILLGALYVAPSFNEKASDVCDAMEKRSLRLLEKIEVDDPKVVAKVQPLMADGKGEYARKIVAAKYSGVGDGVGCTLMYWHSMLDYEGYAHDLYQTLAKGLD